MKQITVSLWLMLVYRVELSTIVHHIQLHSSRDTEKHGNLECCAKFLCSSVKPTGTGTFLTPQYQEVVFLFCFFILTLERFKVYLKTICHLTLNKKSQSSTWKAMSLTPSPCLTKCSPISGGARI